MATTRERLHALVDELPDNMLDEVEAAIIDLTEAPYRPLSQAPDDDERVTEEDLAAIRDGREAYARGEYITDDELKRRMGWWGVSSDGRAALSETWSRSSDIRRGWPVGFARPPSCTRSRSVGIS